jgi:hypothetical protein
MFKIIIIIIIIIITNNNYNNKLEINNLQLVLTYSLMVAIAKAMIIKAASSCLPQKLLLSFLILSLVSVCFLLIRKNRIRIARQNK